MTVVEVVKVEVAKMELTDKDILVIKFPIVISREQIEGITQELMSTYKLKNRPLIFIQDVELSVIRKE
jgi:hypothetical protein